MSEELRVSDVMSRDLVVAYPEETVVDAARKMAENNVGSVIVVDRYEKSRVVGILTESDIVKRVVAKGLNPSETLVEDVMTRNPIIVEEDTPLRVAADLMRERGIGHLPVVDKAGRLRGVVTRTDIVRIAPGLIEYLYVVAGSERGGSGEEGE